jgi:branched-chain amino acid transport system ATP-binding protein
MLKLEGIRAGYGDTTVLRDVDLAVPEANVVALLGANGAGKTTLVRTVCGILPAKVGRILLDDRDITRWTPDRRARAGIGYVPEGRGIFRSLTVRQNLRLHTLTVSEAESIDRAVQAFPILGRRLDQIAGTMSGGEQQMLAVARAYAETPRFLLLDEVSMGLAPVVVDEIFDFLGDLPNRGSGLLIIEQYVTRALQLANLVFVLNRGDLIFAGEPAELENEDLFERYLGTSGMPA